jgi:hypothetical protein
LQIACLSVVNMLSRTSRVTSSVLARRQMSGKVSTVLD